MEHHLFPQISHVHYPQISAIVEQTCRDCQVPFRTHPSFLAGVASHYRWLRRMGQPPAVPALPLLLPVIGESAGLAHPSDVTLARR